MKKGTWVNLTMYQTLCADSFNKSVWPADGVKHNIIQYGGLDMKAFNIVFSNGNEDPWQWASLRHSKNHMKSLYINCNDCGHCVDL